MSILLDTLRKYPHLFVNNSSAVIDGRMCKAIFDSRMCTTLSEHSGSCNGCILHAGSIGHYESCLGFYDDNPDLPADLAELQQSNPELFI